MSNSKTFLQGVLYIYIYIYIYITVILNLFLSLSKDGDGFIREFESKNEEIIEDEEEESME